MLNWLQLKRGVQLSKSYETKCDNPAITCYFSATEVKKIINFGWAGHSYDPLSSCDPFVIFCQNGSPSC